MMACAPPGKSLFQLDEMTGLFRPRGAGLVQASSVGCRNPSEVRRNSASQPSHILIKHGKIRYLTEKKGQYCFFLIMFNFFSYYHCYFNIFFPKREEVSVKQSDLQEYK